LKFTHIDFVSDESSRRHLYPSESSTSLASELSAYGINVKKLNVKCNIERQISTLNQKKKSLKIKRLATKAVASNANNNN
jgi:hypothetical protein